MLPNKPWETRKDSFGEEPGGYSKEVQFFKLSLRNQTEFLNAQRDWNFDQQMFNNDLESTIIITIMTDLEQTYYLLHNHYEDVAAEYKDERWDWEYNIT